MDKPFHFPTGTKIHPTCARDDPSAKPLVFPNEMCMPVRFYFPFQRQLLCSTDPAPPAP
jgi:hypothetical protein